MSAEPAWLEHVRGLGAPLRPGHAATLACVLSWVYASYADATERDRSGLAAAVRDASLPGSTATRQHALLYLARRRRDGEEAALAWADAVVARVAAPGEAARAAAQARGYLARADLEAFLRGTVQRTLFD